MYQSLMKERPSAEHLTSPPYLLTPSVLAAPTAAARLLAICTECGGATTVYECSLYNLGIFGSRRA